MTIDDFVHIFFDFFVLFCFEHSVSFALCVEDYDKNRVKKKKENNRESRDRKSRSVLINQCLISFIVTVAMKRARETQKFYNAHRLYIYYIFARVNRKILRDRARFLGATTL